MEGLIESLVNNPQTGPFTRFLLHAARDPKFLLFAGGVGFSAIALVVGAGLSRVNKTVNGADIITRIDKPSS